MELPPNVELVADRFRGLPDHDKAKIIQDLKGKSGETLRESVGKILAEGGARAQFVARIFGVSVPNPGAANKQKQPVCCK